MRRTLEDAACWLALAAFGLIEATPFMIAAGGLSGLGWLVFRHVAAD